MVVAAASSGVVTVYFRFRSIRKGTSQTALAGWEQVGLEHRSERPSRGILSESSQSTGSGALFSETVCLVYLFSEATLLLLDVTTDMTAA